MNPLLGTDTSKFRRPSGFSVINENNILHVLINDTRTTWFYVIAFVGFSDILLQNTCITFKNVSLYVLFYEPGSVMQILSRAPKGQEENQGMLNFLSNQSSQ